MLKKIRHRLFSIKIRKDKTATKVISDMAPQKRSFDFRLGLVDNLLHICVELQLFIITIRIFVNKNLNLDNGSNDTYAIQKTVVFGGDPSIQLGFIFKNDFHITKSRKARSIYQNYYQKYLPRWPDVLVKVTLA